MTDRLYLHDCYIQEFDAEIIDVTDFPNNSVILTQTVFFPESGGQPGDQGTFYAGNTAYEVKDTKQAKENIIHLLNNTIGLEKGTKIHGKLDWNLRYQYMKAHTAQHVISRYFQIELNAETVSTQIRQNQSRLDFHPIDKMSELELQEINIEINKIFSQNLPVCINFLPREKAIAFLQSKKYQTKYLEMVPKTVIDFRIVEVEGYDWAACGGTHVRNTSEIGFVKFIEMKNKGKNKERLIYSFINK